MVCRLGSEAVHFGKLLISPGKQLPVSGSQLSESDFPLYENLPHVAIQYRDMAIEHGLEIPNVQLIADVPRLTREFTSRQSRLENADAAPSGHKPQPELV